MAENGLITARSHVSREETIERLLIALERRLMTVFAHVDHAKEAAVVALKLRPTDLFIFGYDDADTPLIVQQQLMGIDLPHRLLVWKDEDGAVWITYNNPVWLGHRHALDTRAAPELEAMRVSLAGIVVEAGGRAPINLA